MLSALRLDAAVVVIAAVGAAAGTMIMMIAHLHALISK
jgi:hypothetical protein